MENAKWTMRLLISLAILAGCATSKQVALPDGGQGFAVRCDGLVITVADCMNEAAKKCGGAYTILSREDFGVQRLLLVRCDG